jgi:hypothetical protein
LTQEAFRSNMALYDMSQEIIWRICR